MKFLPIPLALLGGFLTLRGQDPAAPKWDVEIPEPISDGTLSLPPPEPEPIDFKVLTSHTQRIQVGVGQKS